MIARLPKQSIVTSPDDPGGRGGGRRRKSFVIKDRLGRLKEEDNAYPRAATENDLPLRHSTVTRRLIMNAGLRLDSSLLNEVTR